MLLMMCFLQTVPHSFRARTSVSCLDVKLWLLQPCCLLPLQKTDSSLFFLSGEFEQISFFFFFSFVQIQLRKADNCVLKFVV